MQVKAQERMELRKRGTEGVAIAPVRRMCLTDKELEKLIHHTLRKYPHLLKHRTYVDLDPKFGLVEKKATGPKFI